MNIEILEEAASQCAHNLFRIKYPDGDATQKSKEMDECISDAIFVINNFMRISANLSELAAKAEQTEDNV
jgi:hypothetical protein